MRRDQEAARLEAERATTEAAACEHMQRWRGRAAWCSGVRAERAEAEAFRKQAAAEARAREHEEQSEDRADGGLENFAQRLKELRVTQASDDANQQGASSSA